MCPRPLIVCVCTGNTCRSPMAQTLARDWLKRRGVGAQVTAFSAGISAYTGEGATDGAKNAMRNRGLSLDTHRARMLTPEIFDGADLVLTMTQGHKQAILQVQPNEKTFTLSEYAGLGGYVDDPFGMSDAVYELCAQQLERLVDKAMERVCAAL